MPRNSYTGNSNSIGPLFDDPERMARSYDPGTSHEAAAQHVRSGMAATQAAKVLAAVKSHPGCTSAELAQLSGLERHAAARRLSDLRRNGLVIRGSRKACSATGARGVSWRPT